MWGSTHTKRNKYLTDHTQPQWLSLWSAEQKSVEILENNILIAVIYVT